MTSSNSALHPAPPLAPAWPVPPIPDVVDVHWIRGASAPPDGAPTLLVEVAHGATATADYDRTAALLESPLPDDLVAFFHVNTDRGAFELAEAVAAAHVAADPSRTALVLRCRVPRTFVDCNRHLGASPADFRAGGLDPGLMPWVTSPRDGALLRARHAAYVATVAAAIATLAPGAPMLLMHTYSPREVGVTVDLDIVTSLRAAYAPGVFETWPLRHAVDVIGRDPAGVAHVPPAFTGALSDACAARELTFGDSATYRLHPSSMGWHYAQRLPGRVACVEVRRDLLAPGGVFEPFTEAPVDPARVAALAAPITEALAQAFGPAFAEPGAPLRPEGARAPAAPAPETPRRIPA